MKYKKLIIVFIVLVFATTRGTINVEAGENGVRTKVISVTNKRKWVKVKVRIVNDTSKEAIYGDEFLLYMKAANGKWKKLKWNKNYAVNSIEYVLMSEAKTKKVFYINKNALEEKLKKNKRYKIKFKISGNIKHIKFKL